MKKNIQKKQLFLTILFFVILSSIFGIDVKAAKIGAHSNADSETGGGGTTTEVGNYSFSTTKNNIITGFDKFTSSDGTTKYVAYTDGDCKDLTSRYGSNNVNCGGKITVEIDGQERTLELPSGSIDADDQARAELWQQFHDLAASDFAGEDGNINPNSTGYIIGVWLGGYTGDSAMDTEMLENEGSLVSYDVEKGALLKVHESIIEMTASDVTEKCAAYVNKVGSYCKAIGGSRGDFSDEGFAEAISSCSIKATKKCPDCTKSEIVAACCVEEYGESSKEPGGACCKYFSPASECNPTTENPPTDSDSDECAYKPVEPYTFQPKAYQTSSSTPATCGNTYKNITYTYSTDQTCKVVYQKQTITVIKLNAPSNSVYYAGSVFNWSSVSSSQTSTTGLYDTTPLLNEISKLQAKIVNVTKLIGSYNCQISNIQKQIANIKFVDAEKECGEIADETAKAECLKSVARSNQKASEAKENMTKSIDGIKKSIEKAQKDESYLNAKAELEAYQGCVSKINSSKSTTSTVTNVASSSGETMTLKNSAGVTFYAQSKGEIVALEKNTGTPLKKSDLQGDILENEKYLTISSDFYIPNSVTSSTKGELKRNVSFGNQSISYFCPFGATNDSSPNIVDMSNIIYRPISLSNPFPNTNSGSSIYRVFGVNWSDELAEKYIKNNRNVSTDNVYNLTPLYTIVLTPSTIKNIRNYNKNNGINDFNMSCDDGYSCISKFLWETFDGIVDESNSCASENGWDASCYNGGVSE